jgi:hypothetical protein
MWPNVVQLETRQLQLEREFQLTREIEAARVRLETTPSPPRAGRLRLPTLPRMPWSLGPERSRS